MMNGVLNIYKEPGMTSFQVVYQIRKLTGEEKIGHTGTLDPDAKGVLPICIGKATKLVDLLMDTDKEYRTLMLFGKSTDTQDISGKTLQEMPADEVKKVLTKEQITQAVQSFAGEIMQMPPMYSAVKVNGVKLVDAARKGKTIERKARRVSIYGFDQIAVTGLDSPDDPVKAFFTVSCSKGTYIRTLCEDIGKKLSVPACMESLERTKTSGLDLSSAITLDEAKAYMEQGVLEEHLIPTDTFLTKYRAITAKEEAVKKLIYGNWLKEEEFLPMDAPKEQEMFRVYDTEGNFYAIYRYSQKDNYFKCGKMFV